MRLFLLWAHLVAGPHFSTAFCNSTRSLNCTDSPGQTHVNLVESNIFSKPYNLNEPNKLAYLLGNQEIYEQFLNTVQGICSIPRKRYLPNTFSASSIAKNHFAPVAVN